MSANVRQCGIGGQWRRQGGFPSANAGGVWGVKEKRRLADSQAVTTHPFLVLFPPIMGGTLADSSRLANRNKLRLRPPSAWPDTGDHRRCFVTAGTRRYKSALPPL